MSHIPKNMYYNENVPKNGLSLKSTLWALKLSYERLKEKEFSKPNYSMETIGRYNKLIDQCTQAFEKGYILKGTNLYGLLKGRKHLKQLPYKKGYYYNGYSIPLYKSSFLKLEQPQNGEKEILQEVKNWVHF